MNTIQLLQKLVAIPSYIGDNNPAFETTASKFLLRYIKENLPQYSVTHIPFEGKRENLLIQNSPQIKILFACHIDTVPPSSATAFDMKIDGDKAHGLGTKDMKGGVVSTLKALEDNTNQGIGVLFYGDEETTFKGINAVTARCKKLFPTTPSIIVSPESRFNLGVGARGIIVLRLAVTGTRAHSARPHLGADATKALFNCVTSVENHANLVASPLGKTTINIAHIHGGLKQSDDTIGYHVGTVPDYCTAIISFRNARTEYGAQEYIHLLKKVAEKYSVTIDADVVENYPARSTAQSVIETCTQLIESAGFTPEVADQTMAGYNDVAILAKALGSPVVNFGPYGEGNHTAEEWVSVQSIEDTATVFRSFISHFCK